jgi:hypothetical protein
MKTFRATIVLYPEIYTAENETEAEQMLEDYKDKLAEVVAGIEFRDYHLSFYEEESEGATV